MSALDLLTARRAYLDALAKSQRACDVRGALPVGSSRAKVTTANARWANAAEERDRALTKYRDALLAELAALGCPVTP